jgi:hypothetical protein
MTSQGASSPTFAVLFTALALGCASLASGCDGSPSEPAPSSNASAAAAVVAPPEVDEGERCRARASEIEGLAALPGAPGFEAKRIAMLGRARGEPMVFVRAPKAVDPETLSTEARRSYDAYVKERAGSRVLTLVKRHKADKATLRTILLREGYAYSEDTADALALAQDIKLHDVFDEPALFLQRGAVTHKLTRVQEKKDVRYVFEGGALAGITADLLFGDRVALAQDELATPLHRDIAALADEVGFDRAAIVRLTDKAIILDLRFGERTARAVAATEGASARLECLAEDAATRDEIAAYRAKGAPKRRALRAIREAVTSIVAESMRFDRPLDEKGPDKDGQLRPLWMTAYLQGRASFQSEDRTYPVFDMQGRAWPFEVCVDFVLDSFERASGTWFRPKGEALGRTIGRFTWVDDMRQTRGVIGFAERAEKHPEMFEVRRFVGNERIQFGERERFFKFLAEHTSEIHAGDVVAIHGYKRDDRIHQHAILVERTDPITGFAFALADQMRRPRRRTWEGIMAEAPKRSLLFRVHPKDEIFAAIDPGEPIAARDGVSSKL